jgi:alanyl-tRNA synthetase
MQQFKNQFKDESYKGITLANVQSCIRLNDFDFMGDGTHLGHFEMMGLFSFRDWTVKQAIDFWTGFLDLCQLKVDYVTIHPDCPNWADLHKHEVRLDPECKWTDGEIGGYCTEFYSQGIEIGNIVNPLGTCIDVGFGFERLDKLINGTLPKTREECLKDVIVKIVDSGYKPGHKNQGYVLKRLLRQMVKEGFTWDHPLFITEVNRQSRMKERYEALLPKHPNQTKEWWYSTHGIEM